MTTPTASADLALGPELTIPFAATCRDTLLQALADTAGDLRLDLSGVTDVDSAGLQLLLCTRRSLVERGHSLQIVACSDTVEEALAIFGLGELLVTTDLAH